MDRVLEQEFPVVESQNKQQFKDSIADQVNQLLALIYALLSLSIIVSLFGIVNTLVLSIHERTREIGMMRAIGTSRRQIRRIIRYESVITALLGAALGVAIGLLLGAMTTDGALGRGAHLRGAGGQHPGVPGAGDRRPECWRRSPRPAAPHG